MIKRLLIRWVLRELIKMYQGDIEWQDLDKLGIEDMMPDRADKDAIAIIVRKDLSTLD